MPVKSTTKKAAKKNITRVSKISKKSSSVSKSLPTKNFSISQIPSLKTLLPIIIAVIVGTGLFFGAKKYRSLLIAAVVDKSPITTWELNKTLTSRYGSSVLDELINQKLLLEIAAKEKISVNASDVDEEIKKLEDNLGGKDALQKAMDQYGMTLNDLKSQINVRLLQQKLAEKLIKVEVTDSEIQKYYDDNKLIYKDKKLADVKDEIKTSLTQQKLQQQFVEWFQNKKQETKIEIYLTK